MPHTATQSTPAAAKEIAPALIGDSDADCLYGNRKAIAQATRASHARKLSGRARRVDPTTSERDYLAAELEFMQAMQDYKQRSGRNFPTWSEVLEVLLGLGYAKATGGDAIPLK